MKWVVLPYARRRRRRLAGTTVVCVTGSVGKTTTKHVLAGFLGASRSRSPSTARRG